MKTLFDKTSMKNIDLKNRFIRSATWENRALENGSIDENIIDIYSDLADGGVGLIITSYAYITNEEKPNPRMLGIYDDSLIEVYTELVDTVHKKGSKIMMQIVYGGSSTSYNTESRTILGPSSVPNINKGTVPKEMSKDDIKHIVDSFSKAALRCKIAGFDGVQIHGAHGYLLSQFLDPHHNKRTDEYGGSIENRSRIILEVYRAVRNSVGDDYHVGIKINSSDNRDGGATIDDCLYTTKELDKSGIDSIEVSGGGFYNLKGESYFKDDASKVAASVNCPVILVGGNRTVDDMNNILNNTNIEYFSMARPLIREPELINLYKEDNSYKPKCINCGNCMNVEKTCIFN
jgi:2,4-dienoyl-CoA reductase-like NADH-dependent reductase (Old Yellow Enzyme family)